MGDEDEFLEPPPGWVYAIGTTNVSAPIYGGGGNGGGWTTVVPDTQEALDLESELVSMGVDAQRAATVAKSRQKPSKVWWVGESKSQPRWEYSRDETGRWWYRFGAHRRLNYGWNSRDVWSMSKWTLMTEDGRPVIQEDCPDPKARLRTDRMAALPHDNVSRALTSGEY